MAELELISKRLIEGDREAVVELVRHALRSGVDAERVLDEGLIPAMDVVGERFEKNEFYVPEMLIAARAMQAGTDVLEPALAESGVRPKGTAVFGTVKGDLHDIGKNLVVMMLKGAGFKTVDLGVDVAAEQFVDAAEAEDADIVGVSALLTTTMPAMRDVVEALREAGLETRVMVGGAPMTAERAAELGADAYAPDAGTAVERARELVGAG